MNRLKLRDLLHDKYRERFYAKENEWSAYVHAIGCTRSLDPSPNSIECPDSYHRVYDTHWIDIPEELAVKFLVLGLP